MDVSRPLPNHHLGAASSDPILPPAPARPAPQFERRSVEVSLPERPGHRHTSPRSYLYIALGLGSFAVGAWFALAAYIYG